MWTLFFLLLLIDDGESYKLEICVYQTDALKVDTRVTHPSVIISIIDTTKWEYLKTNNTTNHENMYIDPIIIKEFDFKFHK